MQNHNSRQSSDSRELDNSNFGQSNVSSNPLNTQNRNEGSLKELFGEDLAQLLENFGSQGEVVNSNQLQHEESTNTLRSYDYLGSGSNNQRLENQKTYKTSIQGQYNQHEVPSDSESEFNPTTYRTSVQDQYEVPTQIMNQNILGDDQQTLRNNEHADNFFSKGTQHNKSDFESEFVPTTNQNRETYRTSSQDQYEVPADNSPTYDFTLRNHERTDGFFSKGTQHNKSDFESEFIPVTKQNRKTYRTSAQDQYEVPADNSSTYDFTLRNYERTDGFFSKGTQRDKSDFESEFIPVTKQNRKTYRTSVQDKYEVPVDNLRTHNVTQTISGNDNHRRKHEPGQYEEHTDNLYSRDLKSPQVQHNISSDSEDGSKRHFLDDKSITKQDRKAHRISVQDQDENNSRTYNFTQAMDQNRIGDNNHRRLRKQQIHKQDQYEEHTDNLFSRDLKSYQVQLDISSDYKSEFIPSQKDFLNDESITKQDRKIYKTLVQNQYEVPAENLRYQNRFGNDNHQRKQQLHKPLVEDQYEERVDTRDIKSSRFQHNISSDSENEFTYNQGESLNDKSITKQNRNRKTYQYEIPTNNLRTYNMDQNRFVGDNHRKSRKQIHKHLAEDQYEERSDTRQYDISSDSENEIISNQKRKSHRTSARSQYEAPAEQTMGRDRLGDNHQRLRKQQIHKHLAEGQYLNRAQHDTSSDSENELTSNQSDFLNDKPITKQNKSKDKVNTESQKRIHKVITSHKYYSHDPKIPIKYGNDLSEYIPGFYRLLDLHKDEGSNGLVDKIIIYEKSLEKLCNDMNPLSFKSISEISYAALNSISFRLIGCYGNHALIAKLLLKKNLINEQLYNLLIASHPSSMDYSNKPSLRPGIYLLMVNTDLGLIIHWPEIGCYEENTTTQRKKNMINLHRYLTKLTDRQICFMSDKDLESFDWNLDNADDIDSDEEEVNRFKFVVMKSQEEQEDFKIYPGFKVNLSSYITDINNQIQDDIPLYPIVVESTTSQSFVTRQLIKKTSKSSTIKSSIDVDTFPGFLKPKLQDHYLHFDRKSMNMKALEIFVKYGLGLENEHLKPYYNALEAARQQDDSRKRQERDEIREDIEIIKAIASKKLKNSYSYFEQDIPPLSQRNNISENDSKRIRKKYPEMENKIMEVIQIDSVKWKGLKQRYYLTYNVVESTLKKEKAKNARGGNHEVIKSAIGNFNDMFKDKEKDINKLFKKYTNTNIISSLCLLFNVKKPDEIVKKSIQTAKDRSDVDFIKDLLKPQLFEEYSEDINGNIMGDFVEEYKRWRKSTFQHNFGKILPILIVEEQNNKLTQEYREEKQKIEEDEFVRICDEIENKYNDGSMRLNVIKVTEIYPQNFGITLEVETARPIQLQIAIHETSLEQTDSFQIHDDELHVPTPNLPLHYHTIFPLDPSIHDFRKIFQFDERKFLLVLWNKNKSRIEIFFDTAPRLAQGFKKSSNFKPFKILNNISEKVLVAINEPKELIALYDPEKAALNVFSFNDNRSNLYGRNTNIQLLQWYNHKLPYIKYFLFIKDTEELCFVENGGRARIFNLVNQQFKPAVCKFPPNTENVLSSPDGSCIIAFVRKKIEDNRDNKHTTVKEGSEEETEEETDSDSDNEQSDSIKDDNVNEKCYAHVYFYTKFGSVSKVIDLPASIQSLEFLQFTCINKIQTHLMSLDLENGWFNSAIVKITQEKTQYRFQERMQKKSHGLVKFIDSTHIEGKNTSFEKIMQNGENIVIMGEKYNVINVLSNTKLEIAGNFKPESELNKWVEFRIEPKTKLNGLIDAYKLMFEKYQIDSCIDPEQNRPLSLKIALDINDDEIEEYGEKFEKYISGTFAELKRTAKKPAKTLKKFSTSAVTFQNLNIEDVTFRERYPPKYDLGEWIIQLCCLIPIQIAVARNGLFQPLRDGLSSNEYDQIEFNEGYGHHVDSIAKNISFGWYEGVFKHFGDKKVKVVSSMGEQSCGKSYMLNHLVGTTFDGSAMRCTEGVWMSLVNTKEYIYVALDFEGLKSLERTPQEDLFLTLFNTIVSNLILFKNQFAINRDMSTMFQRFQDGATLFESDPKLFQAELCIIIKDVPKADQKEIVKEFRLRFNQLVAEEGEDNFITRMYKGGLDIIPWPMFNEASWFKRLTTVKKTLDAQEAKYENARTFLQNTKVIMAKLKICDWGSLDDNLMQICVATLKRSLPVAISYGLEQREPMIEQLTNHDTGEQIQDPIIKISDILQDSEDYSSIIPDSNFPLYDEHGSFVRLSENLRCYFDALIQPRKESPDDNDWFANFDRFFKYFINRRVSRIKDWYAQNTAKFPQDSSDIVNGKYAMEHEITKLTLLWTLCGLTCNQCGLKCVKNRDHNEEHDCLTDHKCHFPCHFTEAHQEELVSLCSHKAGHEGKHACNTMNHSCGKPCNLIDKRNCQKVCSKEIDHDDDVHLCQSTRHYCGEDCSLSTNTQKGEYHCSNKCIVPYEEEHDRHYCEFETCPIQCPIPDCQRKCQSDDHFHSYHDTQVDHFCENEHQCLELCEEDGICRVNIEPKKEEEFYNGLVQGTYIAFTKYIQLSERLRCNKKIPPNQFKHEGIHSHEENGFHHCNAKCQFCEYFCTLPYGHAQIHDTRHGNMIQTEFTGEDDEFEFDGHKLKVGDQGTFVLCNLYCKDLGRHRHIDYCQNVENCVSAGQDIQHIDKPVEPNRDRPKDFISHKLFWERTGFKDPYSNQEQQEFAKCDHECPDEIHQKSQESNVPFTKSFCELPLFHPPLNPSSNPPNDIGYISGDGHHFYCDNPSTKLAAFHIIFCLDYSSSMRKNDNCPIEDTPIYDRLVEKHNNRLGTVYNAVYTFLATRIASVEAMQDQSSVDISDKVSMILFNQDVVVPFENQAITEPDKLLDTMLQYEARGGTNYDLAIQRAGLLITTYFDPEKVNVVVFLSDGECGVPSKQLNNICKQNQMRNSPLYLYTVLFSEDKCTESLEQMANIAQSYHSPNTSSGALRCQFTYTVDEVNLVNHFTGVAESLRNHKPALLRKNELLQHDGGYGLISHDYESA